MATIFRRKSSPFWQISYFFDGKRITKSLGTSDRTLAKAEKKRIEVELEQKTHEEYGKLSLTELSELYQSAKGERGRLTNKYESYELAAFVREVAKRNVEAVTEGDILKYLSAYREKSPLTFNNKLAVIKRLFAFAVKKRKISGQKNPAEMIDRKRVFRTKPTYFTDDEYLAIQKAAEGSPLFPMITVARYTGLRLAELRHLEWQDFDWHKREVAVKNKLEYGHTVKTYEERNVPIAEELIFKLLPFRKEAGLCFASPKGGVYSLQGPKKALGALLKAAGLKEKGDGWHRFRRTFASRLVQQGVTIQLVSKWLGHSSITVTEKFYADFKPGYDVGIEKLNIPTADKIADSPINDDAENFDSSIEKWGGRRGSNPRPQDPQI